MSRFRHALQDRTSISAACALSVPCWQDFCCGLYWLDDCSQPSDHS